jgi:hypothetical protein
VSGREAHARTARKLAFGIVGGQLCAAVAAALVFRLFARGLAGF